jgi:hypothetical protein
MLQLYYSSEEITAFRHFWGNRPHGSSKKKLQHSAIVGATAPMVAGNCIITILQLDNSYMLQLQDSYITAILQLYYSCNPPIRRV